MLFLCVSFRCACVCLWLCCVFSPLPVGDSCLSFCITYIPPPLFDFVVLHITVCSESLSPPRGIYLPPPPPNRCVALVVRVYALLLLLILLLLVLLAASTYWNVVCLHGRRLCHWNCRLPIYTMFPNFSRVSHSLPPCRFCRTSERYVAVFDVSPLPFSSFREVWSEARGTILLVTGLAGVYTFTTPSRGGIVDVIWVSFPVGEAQVLVVLLPITFLFIWFLLSVGFSWPLYHEKEEKESSISLVF